MQQNKDNKFNGELGSLVKDSADVKSKIEEVMDLFTIRKQLSVFNTLKSHGHEVSKLLSILVLLPFYGIGNIYNMVQANIAPENKDAYYTIKNNEHIDWRKLLVLFAKRFCYLTNRRGTMKKTGITALIGDDSPLHKTGKKTENISMVHDHVTNTFILGFKILVVGYWDGGSFIPIDFSIHREKGSRLQKAKDALKSANKTLQSTADKLKKAKASFQKKQDVTAGHRSKVKTNPTSTNIKNMERSIASYQKAKAKVSLLEKELAKRQSCQKLLKEKQGLTAKKSPEYGLSRKEKKQQFKKNRDNGSYGHIRSREADTSKTSMFITMVKRAVSNGFVPDYVLTDSWFFCRELLKTIDKLSTKGVKLLSMAKMGNATYTLLPSGKTYNAQALLNSNERKASYNRKLKARYIKIPVMYFGIRINLFFVKMGQKASWRLLATNDLNLGFIKMMEVYQIRWSIEVFFKESKQYLNLGRSCSSDFDGQIADATLSMIQHIMLTFFKRMNHQQSFGGLFKAISGEMVESSLAEKLWEIFLHVIMEFGEILKLDILEIHEQTMRNEKAMLFMKQLIFQKSNLKNVA